MDDLTRRRLDNALNSIVEYGEDSLFDDDVEVPTLEPITTRFLALGLREDALEFAWTPIVDMVSTLAIRMLRHGVNKDACHQVVYGVWSGRTDVPELAAMPQELRRQTRRILDFALDETVPLVNAKPGEETAADVVWFAMSLTIDLMARTAVTS